MLSLLVGKGLVMRVLGHICQGFGEEIFIGSFAKSDIRLVTTRLAAVAGSSPIFQTLPEAQRTQGIESIT